MRVLAVEDDRLLAETVARGLRQAAPAVDVVLDGDAALERVAMTRYDVVVLDRDLSEVHGDDVCRAAVERWQGSVRVLMMTGAVDVRSRVAGLNLGADDYLPKAVRVRGSRRAGAGAAAPVRAREPAGAAPGGRAQPRGRLGPGAHRRGRGADREHGSRAVRRTSLSLEQTLPTPTSTGLQRNKIRRLVTAVAALLTPGLAFASPASAGVTQHEVAVDKPPVKGEVVVQHGVVTAPVVTGTGKGGEVLTLFKVNDERTRPWVATAETVVIKGGVPATAIAQGDHVGSA